MRKYICGLGILFIGIILLGGCTNSKKIVNENEHPLTKETESDIKNEVISENTNQAVTSVSIANVIHLSDWISDDLNIYLKYGETEEEGKLSDYNLEQGDIVQLNEQGSKDFVSLMNTLTIEKVDTSSSAYPQYHILLKNEKTNSMCHIEVWTDGIICINWMNYYKISGEWDSSIIEKLFEKSTEVQLLTIEDAFKKMLEYRNTNSFNSLNRNDRNNLEIVLDSGMTIYKDETVERPYKTTLENIGYNFDDQGTRYDFQLVTIWYESDGKTIFDEQSTIAGYIDYISGELIY